MSDRPPPLPPGYIRDPGDAWVYGPDGAKFWGLFGAAGLLVWHPSLGILLQHRVGWSHFGGTWGLPGGARKEGESAFDGALREAAEEATVPAHLLRIIHTSVLDLGYWSYTTVVAEAIEVFEPIIADAESAELRWVPVIEVDSLPLHPGFGDAWAGLRTYLAPQQLLVEQLALATALVEQLALATALVEQLALATVSRPPLAPAGRDPLIDAATPAVPPSLPSDAGAARGRRESRL